MDQIVSKYVSSLETVRFSVWNTLFLDAKHFVPSNETKWNYRQPEILQWVITRQGESNRLPSPYSHPYPHTCNYDE